MSGLRAWMAVTPLPAAAPLWLLARPLLLRGARRGGAARAALVVRGQEVAERLAAAAGVAPEGGLVALEGRLAVSGAAVRALRGEVERARVE